MFSVAREEKEKEAQKLLEKEKEELERTRKISDELEKDAENCRNVPYFLLCHHYKFILFFPFDSLLVYFSVEKSTFGLRE